MSELIQIEEIAQVKQGRYTSPSELSTIPTEQAKVPVWGANGILGYTQTATYQEAQPLVTCRGNGCGLIQWSGGRAHISNNAMAILLKEESRDSSKYLYYSLLHSDFSDVTTGSAQPQITMGHLNKKEIFWHSDPNERAQIAHILGTLDDKIELNRKTNETLEAMAKALFKSWFVDFDPVRAKAEGRPTGLPDEISDLFPDSFEDSELGEIPSGWQASTIGEKIKWNHGKTWEAHLRVEDSPITALGSNGIMGKSAIEMGCDRIVVMGNRGSCGALNDFNGAYWVTNNAYYITEKENPHFEYWRQVLRSIDFAPFIGGSSNPFMPLKNFAHIGAACPPDSLLRYFSQSAVTIREKIERIDKENAILSQIRDTLLPKLISGEIRIPDAERMLEEVGV